MIDFDCPADILDMFLTGKLDLFEFVHKIQILFYGHVHIQRRLLRQITDMGLGCDRILQNLMSINGHSTFRTGEVAGNDVHGGGFPRAVWPQETQDFSPFNGKADVVDGIFVAIPFDEVFDL